MYFNFILHLQLNGHIDGVRLEVYEKIMWITLWCNNCISFVAIDLLSVCWVLGLKGSATYLETLSVFVGRALKPYCYRLILYELECSQCMYSWIYQQMTLNWWHFIFSWQYTSNVKFHSLDNSDTNKDNICLVNNLTNPQVILDFVQRMVDLKVILTTNTFLTEIKF